MYKRQVHDTTGVIPAKLVVERKIHLPGDSMFGSPETQFQELQNYSLLLQKQLREMDHLVRGQLKRASDKMKTLYDICSNNVDFEEGQVWSYNPKHRLDRSPKLKTNWEAPYTVKKRINRKDSRNSCLLYTSRCV